MFTYIGKVEFEAADGIKLANELAFKKRSSSSIIGLTIHGLKVEEAERRWNQTDTV